MLDQWNNMQIAQSLKRQHENIKTKTENQALAVSFVAVAVPSWMNDDREKWTKDLLKRAKCIHKFQLIGWLSRLFGFLFHSINTFRQHFHFDHCCCVQQWCDAETNNTNSDICHTWYLHLLRLDVPKQIQFVFFHSHSAAAMIKSSQLDCDRRHLFHGQSIKIRVQVFFIRLNCNSFEAMMWISLQSFIWLFLFENRTKPTLNWWTEMTSSRVYWFRICCSGRTWSMPRHKLQNLEQIQLECTERWLMLLI